MRVDAPSHRKCSASTTKRKIFLRFYSGRLGQCSMLRSLSSWRRLSSRPSSLSTMPTRGQPCPCKGCGVVFESKNAVFRHLNETVGACLPDSERDEFLEFVYHQQKREKVVLLYGYWIPPHNKHHTTSFVTLKDGEDAARLLLEVAESLVPLPPGSPPSANITATAAASNPPPHPKINRSYGQLSRGGTGDAVAQEEGTSAITELVV